MSHMLMMLWVAVNLTLCLKKRENHIIVVGLLKGCLITSGPDLFSLLLDLSVMVAPCVTIQYFTEQVPVRTRRFENSPIPYFIKILN